MTFLSYFKKTLLVLLSIGLISTANAMEDYVIGTSDDNEAISSFKHVTNISKDEIDRIVDGKPQNLIFMIKGTQDNVLQKIPEIFKNFVTAIKDDPEGMLSNVLYSGGITLGKGKHTKEITEMHDKLIAGTLVKNCCGDAIRNVYAPSFGNGYSIEFDQARVFYEINDPKHLKEFWHTEPAAIEQFLVWKDEGKVINNVLVVSQKSMCKFCSRFLLHSFCTEDIAQKNVGFVVISLSLLENIQKHNAIDRSSKKIKFSEESLALQEQLLSSTSEESTLTLLGAIRDDFKTVSSEGNKLAIYCF